jgi:hypothetical protein
MDFAVSHGFGAGILLGFPDKVTLCLEIVRDAGNWRTNRETD